MKTPNRRDDLFSLACLMYRLLAGRRVFGPLTALEAEAQGAEPLPVAGMDAGRWDALSRALAFRRDDRQRNVREFVAEYCAAPDVERVDEAFDTTSLPIIDTVSDAGREAAPELKPGMQVDVVFDESEDEFQETDAAVIFESALARAGGCRRRKSAPPTPRCPRLMTPIRSRYPRNWRRPPLTRRHLHRRASRVRTRGI